MRRYSPTMRRVLPLLAAVVVRRLLRREEPEGS